MMKFMGIFLFLMILTLNKKKYNNKMIRWVNMISFMSFVSLSILFFMPKEEFFSLMNSFVLIDSLSLSLIVLSIYLSIIMLTSSFKVMKVNFYSGFFTLAILVLLLLLIVSFIVNNYLMFYFFFEASLIPTFFIILGWGYQPERIQAGIYFMMYTIFASLPLLLSFILIYMNFGSSHMMLGLMLELNYLGMKNSLLNLFFFIFMVFAFLVKMPMFIFHLWLPKAHVEAPVAGSMILAGVLLKLGGYGLSRVLGKFSYILKNSNFFIMSLSLMSMVYVGYMCCRLNDFKSLVAYSSVAHMSLVIAGLFTGNIWGSNGGFMMMISHGLSSSGLFCSVNMYYERLGSRSFFINKGIMNFLPVMSLFFFLLCGANISAPPSINLLSEIFLMSSIMSYDFMMVLIFPLGSFLGAIFTLFMFSYSQHGKFFSVIDNFIFSLFLENHSLILHIIPIYLIFINPLIFLVWL